VQKIRDVQDSLEGRIEELETALASVHSRLRSLRERFEAVRRRADETAGNVAAPAEGSADVEDFDSSRLRVAA
jgi:hypothetical protein